jgi:hypothetical protein
MRWGVYISLIVLGIAQVGCASKPVASAPAPVAQHASAYDGAVAASLVFSPPVASMGEQQDFSREGRAPTAYAGFEEVTTFYYLYQDDHQQRWGGGRWGGGNNDHFERQAITQRVGVSYR